MNVSVHGAGDTSDEALAAATTKMNAVLAALKALSSVKIAEDDLETQGVNTARDWENEGRYVSDQSLGVTSTSRRAGAVIAAATAAGADSVDGPSFSLDEQTAAYRDALRGALADARSKADAAERRWASRSSARARSSRTRAAAARSCTPPTPPPRPESAPPVKIGPVTVSAQVT